MPPVSVRIPSWADPQNASVLDNWWERTARTLGGMLGAADPASQAMAIGAPVELPGGAGGPGQRLLGKAIKAYHGSPHDFDQFSLGKIGTGEGGQAYGYGLYFAENPAVAKQYREALADPTVRVMGKDVPVPGWSSNMPPESRVIRRLADKKMSFPDASVDEIVSKVRSDIDSESMQAFRADRPDSQMVQHLGQQRTHLDEIAGRGIEIPQKGHGYEVNLHASPDELLDWDKPLSQQSPKVQEALKGVFPEEFEQARKVSDLETQIKGIANRYGSAGESYSDAIAKAPADVQAQWRQLVQEHRQIADANLPTNGEQIYQRLVGKLGGRIGHTEGIASQKLKDAGIKGIQYLDQGSRAAGEGTKNFVIFDDKIIEIAKKYGVALPVAASIYKYQQAQQK